MSGGHHPCWPSAACRFGENLDPDVLSSAQRAVEDADLFLTVGTSSVVYPAAGFVSQVLPSPVRGSSTELAHEGFVLTWPCCSVPSCKHQLWASRCIPAMHVMAGARLECPAGGSTRGALRRGQSGDLWSHRPVRLHLPRTSWGDTARFAGSVNFRRLFWLWLNVLALLAIVCILRQDG